MKNSQKQQAEDLFFQTDLSKSQIAKLIGISRRTLHYWIRENNWSRIKKSAANLPIMLAEHLYLAMGHLTQSILSESRILRPITKQEADTLHKLALTIGKLKKGVALNESMEMFACFMEEIHSKDPGLAKQVQPFVNAHIQARAAVHPSQFMPDSLNDQGYIPAAPAMPSAQDLEEARLDMEDIMAWSEDIEPIISPEHSPKGNEFATSDVRHCDQPGNLDENLMAARHCEARSQSEWHGRAGNLSASMPSVNTDQMTKGDVNNSTLDCPDYAELLQQDREARASRADSILQRSETILKTQPKETLPPSPPVEVNPDPSSGRAGVRPNRKQRRAIAARQAKSKTRLAA